MSTSDYLGKWREQEAMKLTNKVQTRFKQLQNPNDCNNQNKFICNINKNCGFGCQLHHLMYCFITAYYNNRTMILDSTNWNYNKNGYETYFKPMSQKCNIKNLNDKIVDLDRNYFLFF